MIREQQNSHHPPNTMPRRFLLAAFVLMHLSRLVSAQTTIPECGPNLIQLVQCAPFVQGMAATPIQSCCNALAQLHDQKPACICLLLNDTSLAASFPVNTTLVLQLPILCNLQIDPSSCPGTSLSPPSEVSFGARPNSSVAASPIVTVSPRPSSMVTRSHHSSEMRLKSDGQLSMLLATAIFIVLATVAEP